jgi:hypothetical protein
MCMSMTGGGPVCAVVLASAPTHTAASMPVHRPPVAIAA